MLQILRPYNGELAFRRIQPKSYDELDEHINNISDYIEEIRSKIMMLIIAHPKDLTNEKESVMEMADRVSLEILEELEDLIEVNEQLVIAASLVVDCANKIGCTYDEAFCKVVVDMNAHIRKDLGLQK